MRFHTILGCIAAALLPQLALATDPPGELGALQAVYDFCSKVDPAQRGDFERRAGELLKGLTPQHIAGLHKSKEYQRSYQVIAGVLPELKGPDAVEGCHAISGVRSGIAVRSGIPDSTKRHHAAP